MNTLLTLLLAVNFLYDVDFTTYFDNHESQTPLEESSTLFGVRLTPTIGVGYSDSIVGSHRLMAGVSYIQPFGSKWREAKLTPTIYYQFAYTLRNSTFQPSTNSSTFQPSTFNLYFGFIPYSQLYDPLPDYLMSDSMTFVYPNIQGALFQYGDARGHAELFCDWRGMMSDSTREAFRIVGQGRGYMLDEAGQRIYAGGVAMLNHLSHSNHILGVCDDITVNPLVGYSYDNGGKRYRGWGARLEAGYLMSWQRDRRANYSVVSHGFRGEAELRWWFVSIREQLYAGGNAMSLYPKYGTLLNQGEQKYQSPVYSRTDIRLQITKWQFITIYAGWNLLYTQGHPLSQQQQVYCHFNLDQLLKYIGKR